MNLPIEIWYQIANSININDLIKLEKAINIDLTYIARILHKQKYKEIINDINTIDYWLEVYGGNCARSLRSYQRYCVSYFGGQKSLNVFIGYYSCEYSYVLEVRGKKYNKNGMLCNQILYSNRSLVYSKKVDEYVNRIVIYRSDDLMSINSINSNYQVIYPWS